MSLSNYSLKKLQKIINQYQNFQCVECAEALEEYLSSQGIRGKRIKLYTGFGIGRNSYIYDDSVPGDAISRNGHHEAIAIIIDEQEIVFDNHHSEGILKEQWLSNLLFYGLLHEGLEFQIKEEHF